MEAPTSFLPPLKRLGDYNGPQIHNILTRLVTIYLPKVRGTTLIDEDTEPFQSDDFERSFAIRWLTGFIARGEEWTELYTDEEDPGALLGACAGTSASGAISRELKFATSSAPFTGGSTHLDGPNPDSSTITILLQDESISAGDHTAVGLQTWGSACILAERIARDPLAFGLPDTSPDSSSRSKGARVLELGAGTGLLSLLAGKLVECAGAMTGNVDSKYTIVATDYHPAVLANLRANVQGNFPDSSAESDSLIDVQTLDCQASKTPVDPPFDQPFDVIFGADVVYELSHITLVRGVVERLLRKPSYKLGARPAYFHLIMPLRPTHADEANSVDMAFPRAEDIVSKGVGEDEVLAIVKTETYARSAGVGRADEVQYVHYCIGWV
ncbi:methyltransferase domain protein [Rhizoctonia solani 123E]|uniref:Methyltransferase domain protein n=1 Tax=Rhizoctonia solani 123E TaxID=1423351 RepID=A0A074SPD4_9AGAM|nr:methyltransferase domain protein [Rhizoctonia solani 123E]